MYQRERRDVAGPVSRASPMGPIDRHDGSKTEQIKPRVHKAFRRGLRDSGTHFSWGAVMRVLPLASAGLLSLLLSSAVCAQAQNDGGGQPDWLSQAKIAAEMEGISVGEAVRRARLQNKFLAEVERLTADSAYAGSWIVRDKDTFKIVHGFKGGKRSPASTGDAELDSSTESASSAYSLQEIEATRSSLDNQFKDLKIRGGFSVDLENNKLVVRSPDVEKINALVSQGLLTLPPFVVVSDKVRFLGTQAAISGGGETSSCTAAFTVSNGSTTGISTAGHCALQTLHRGASIGTRQAPFSSLPGSDFSWYRNNANTYLNRVLYGSSYYTITSVAALPIPTRTSICIIKRDGTQPCGLSADYYSPVGGGGPIVVMDRYLTVSGDSGGPWLYGSKAYGLHGGPSCDDEAKTVNCKSYFSPAASLPKIGVAVITTP